MGQLSLNYYASKPSDEDKPTEMKDERNQGQPGLLVLQVRRLDLQTPATTFVKLIAKADILALPPIVSIDFVQRFFAYHVAAALVLLFQHNMHPLPDPLLARTRRLKLRWDTPWETLQAMYLPQSCQ
ncbi:hypothetical protein PTTG_28206 [Puccinia triticina 1-1 BBBD Race 1]|uniref:Uncharacterized protein n=2 Tax=Puccinia triticina TaxID=208348 RepID=A0A180GDU8_PUCT1|nr:uncharacterized protein PtA15_18A361 [Puccinia triticina]OAV90791.1 hypothetical protein PTTG_28206 [Puccinia triticina 1-1 BBBD Race 1]WAQ93301.1 hypothetical protein PtA15_18A361 [Puccinia triticina]WAR63291.1 hypothetical protein PtB15_18B374 [Puccinia triticina]